MILYHHELFSRGIANLLRAAGFDVVTLDAHSDKALRHTHALRPQVVMLEDDEANHPVFSARLAGILDEGRNVIAIQAKTGSNWVMVYSKRQILVGSPDDLVRAIGSMLGNQPEGTSTPAATKQMGEAE